VRIDRGFDPREKAQDARFDEYFLRYSPLKNGEVNFQVGKFATVVGSWVPRHDSWQNPFINAPVPYENIVTISDQGGPPSSAQFLGRKRVGDLKDRWVPIVWGPSYASGASIFGRISKFDYGVEIKNASLSSRPSSWNAFEQDWEHPTLSGRAGWRPNASWNLGVSGSGGTYLGESAEPSLPSGKGINDFEQFTLATDVSYARHHWQIWAEVFASRFDVPFAGKADTLAWYLEVKYKFTAQFFGAVRWNQQWFNKIKLPNGQQEVWDNDLWRSDFVLGYRFTRHIQAKLQYSYSHQRGNLQQGEQLVAGQVAVKF
jgi:hypothetical protein